MSYKHFYLYKNLAFLLKKDLRKNIQAEILFYKELIGTGKFIFDVGASLGGRTFIFKKLKAKKIIAIEPDESAFKILKKTFGNFSEIIILKIGLGSKNEFKGFLRSNSSTLSTFDDYDASKTKNDKRFNNIVFEKAENIEIRTLDSLIDEFGMPYFCKISTVGYELEIIKGLTHQIPIISLGCNIDYHIDKTIECVNLISKLGNYKFNYAYSSILNGLYEKKWIESTEMVNNLNKMRNIEFSKYIEIFAQKIN